jgi:hypothetical protein
MWKSRLLYVLKKLLVISAYVAIAAVIFVGAFIYALIAAILSDDYTYGTGLGYQDFSFPRWYFWRRRWKSYWE